MQSYVKNLTRKISKISKISKVAGPGLKLSENNQKTLYSYECIRSGHQSKETFQNFQK